MDDRPHLESSYTFFDYEKTAIRKLHAALHPQDNTPSLLLSTTPTVTSNQPSTLVNPYPSLPTRPVNPPLQIPQTTLPIQTAPFPPVPENSTFGGRVVLETKIMVFLIKM